MTKIYLSMSRQAHKRMQLGAAMIREALQELNCEIEEIGELDMASCRSYSGTKLVIANRRQSDFIRSLEEHEVLLYHSREPQEEGFYLVNLPGDIVAVIGGDDTGALYGCQELASMIRQRRQLPDALAFGDGPEMKLRGPVVPLQKTKVEPPRRTYEYPITPDRFPWFYDRALWLEYLDQLLEYRCNVVYIWTGHPFSSLVRLSDYPEALEVTDEEFERNEQMFLWLSEECDRRGIWLVLKFYNIHIPLPFAEKHGLDLHQPKPLPLTSDYYIQSISAFIKNYSNVGIMVCLGEALQGAIYGVEWFNETILKGVKQGLAALPERELPPIIVRAHAIPSEKVMSAAIPEYGNLFTEAKFNGESLTTYTPRGNWQQIHRNLSALGSIHLFNVHILANLEPFRFGSPSFIQKCVQAAKYRLGCNGLHLYPLFYWDWPYSPDAVEPRLKQLDRDWLWFAAWFRYCWKADSHPALEREYWIQQIAKRYGSREAAASILDAMEHSGECAPKLLRRFGITEGNRQTMSLGMQMSQLTNPGRYGQWQELWEAQAPEGERIDLYVQRELAGEVHIGETPYDIIQSVNGHAEAAEAAISQARAFVTTNKEEFERIAVDVSAIAAMTYSYSAKVRAAIHIVTYKQACNGSYLEHVDELAKAEPYFEESLEHYKRLTELTKETYLYANSMQTPQRKVPFPDGEKYGHWKHCLPRYQQEYANFKQQLERLRQGKLPSQATEAPIVKYKEAEFELLSQHAERYVLDKQEKVFQGGDVIISSVAEELNGLTGIRFDREQAAREGIVIEFELKKPARLLVGYFNSKNAEWLQVPDLEVNTHADDRGGLAPVLKNALQIFFYPSVNIHAFLYEAGRHSLVLGQGAYMIAGVIDADQLLTERDLANVNPLESMDWLYESEE